MAKTNVLSRVWFMARGCKQVPLEYTKNIVRWAHPDGYFLNAQGQKIAHNYSPAQIRGMKTESYSGSCYPNLSPEHKQCHLLMALAFYGDRPTDPVTGKPCICHHLIPDKLDYRPANLLCWLTKEEHTEADRRQKLLRKVLPDLHALTYDRLRTLQDPRVTTDDQFESELQKLAHNYGTKDRL